MFMISLILIILMVFFIVIFSIFFLKKEKYKLMKMEQRQSDYLTLCDHNVPYIYPQILYNFLTKNECDQLLSVANKKGLIDSMVSGFINDNKERKSKQCWLSYENHEIVKDIFHKIEFVTKIPKSHYEEMQVVKYSKDDFFNEHYDQCFLIEDYCKQELRRFSKPRYMTLLIYLNDKNNYDGGETYFKNIDFKFKGNKGDALLFHNLDTSRHYIHPFSLHKGMYIHNGEKYIANVWIRD